MIWSPWLQESIYLRVYQSLSSWSARGLDLCKSKIKFSKQNSLIFLIQTVSSCISRPKACPISWANRLPFLQNPDKNNKRCLFQKFWLNHNSHWSTEKIAMQAKGQSGLQMQFSSVADLRVQGVYLTRKYFQNTQIMPKNAIWCLHLINILMWGAVVVLLWPRSSPTAS